MSQNKGIKLRIAKSPANEAIQTYNGALTPRSVAGTGMRLGDRAYIANTTSSTEHEKNKTAPVIEFPTDAGFGIVPSLFDRGSTISKIVNRMGFEHSGQSPSAVKPCTS